MLAEPSEQEILDGRRCFAVAQSLFTGGVLRQVGELNVGWHDTSISEETGAFCVIDEAGPNLELIGEILSVTRADGRTVYVYCLGGAAVPVDLSLTRRTFLALGRLSLESALCSVAVIE